MNRRTFMKAVAALLAAPAAYVAKVWRGEALRTGRYPGKIKPLNEHEIRRPGKWLG